MEYSLSIFVVIGDDSDRIPTSNSSVKRLVSRCSMMTHSKIRWFGSIGVVISRPGIDPWDACDLIQAIGMGIQRTRRYASVMPVQKPRRHHYVGVLIAFRHSPLHSHTRDIIPFTMLTNAIYIEPVQSECRRILTQDALCLFRRMQSSRVRLVVPESSVWHHQ